MKEHSGVVAVDIRDEDRAADYRRLEVHGKEYRGQWVGVRGGKLIGSAATLRELMREIEGTDAVLCMRIPEEE